MTTNPSPEFAQAQKKYLQAEGRDEQLIALEEMIRTMPQHKSAESLRANLRTRYKKLQESIEKSKKSGKSTQVTLKKETMQTCIVGFPNSGKTSLFKALTNQGNPSSLAFSTKGPMPASMKYQDCNIQVIDMPPFPNEDKSIVNGADTILLVIENLEQLKDSEKFLSRAKGKQVIVYNKIDSLNDQEKRKFLAQLQSKKIPAIVFSAFTQENLEEIKKQIFNSFPICRIYLKEPKKPASSTPLIMLPGATVKEVAEKILKGFSKKVKKAKITGPSAKFPEQIVGLDHIVKDKDIVEFQTI